MNTAEQKVADLLKPRYKVIADWPYMPKHIKVGELASENFIMKAMQYPHLFRKLHWSEEREESDLPKFVGYKNEHGFFNWIYPVVRFTNTENNGEPFSCIISYTNKEGEYQEMEQATWGISPATETEYQQYLITQK